MSIRILLTGLLLVHVAGSAVAAPVKWVLHNVLLEDGGTASGFFVFDRDPDSLFGDYVEVSITTSPGSGAPGSSYVAEYSMFSSATTLRALNNEDPNLADWVLSLTFDAPLDDAGGTRSVIDVQEGPCEALQCQLARESTLPNGTISTVPIPAAAWLFGSALGLVAWMRRSARFSR